MAKKNLMITEVVPSTISTLQKVRSALNGLACKIDRKVQEEQDIKPSEVNILLSIPKTLREAELVEETVKAKDKLSLVDDESLILLLRDLFIKRPELKQALEDPSRFRQIAKEATKKEENND